jgi:hypothetical protein
VHKFINLESLPLPIEFQGFQNDIKTDFVPILEAISKGLLRAINHKGYAIYVVIFDPFLKGRTAKPENTQRWIIQPGRFRATWKGKINLMGNLGRYLVIRKGRYQTDHAFRNLHGNGRKIRITQDRHVGKPIHPSSELLYDAFITHGIKGAGMDACLYGLLHAKYTTVRAE